MESLKGNRSPPGLQQSSDRLAAVDAVRTPGCVTEFAVGPDAEQMEDGGGQVRGCIGLGPGDPAVIVGLALFVLARIANVALGNRLVLPAPLRPWGALVLPAAAGLVLTVTNVARILTGS